MTPLFTFDEMERWFDHFQSKAEDKMLVFLQAGGEKFIEVARRSGSYKDQTGNLRSSIGYIIAKDGEVVTENFKEDTVIVSVALSNVYSWSSGIPYITLFSGCAATFLA